MIRRSKKHTGIGNMFDKLRTMLSRVEADFADLRYEIKNETVIQFDGSELTRIGTNTTDGYVLRVLKNGAMASAVFTEPGAAEQAARCAVENAGLLAGRRKRPVRLADVKAVQDDVRPPLNEDPRSITMAEKLDLTRRYNQLALQHDKIVTTELRYTELARERFFISTAGSQIREDLITVRMSGLLTSKEGMITQNVRVSAGGSDGFAGVREQEDLIELRSALCIDLLSAKPVPRGVHNVILNPSMAGVFTHEAFGHFSEADIIENLPAMRDKMQIGRRLGSQTLTIVDDATQPHQLGYYTYDDEGVPVQKVILMNNGVLAGRLHSRRTAAEFDEPPTGHCVAEDFQYAPIVRMGTIYIAPGPFSFDDLVAQLGDGLYLLDAKGGQTSGESFTFGAQYGYEIRAGKVGAMIRDINISGNLYHTLQNITAIGNDVVLSKAGGCGKQQMNLRSCHGGPHILVNHLVTGGA
jgi:TldD protein